MYELTIVYKQPNGKLKVSITQHLSFERVIEESEQTSYDVGLSRVVSITIRPVSVI